MNTQKLKRFLSNDFKQATLTVAKKDDELITNLFLKEKSDLKASYISVYYEDLDELKQEPKKLCNYMLDSFLANHTVVGISYFMNNKYFYGKTRFNIITTDGILTINLIDCNIRDIFPDFISRTEPAKRKGILQTLACKKIDENGKIKKHFFLSLNEDSRNIKTGLGSYNYNIFSFPQNAQIVIPENEKDFVIRIIQEMFRMYQVTENCVFKKELKKIHQLKKQLSYALQDNFKDKYELEIGNLVFDFYGDERALTQIELIEEAIKGLENEFIDCLTEEINVKQLVMKNYK